MAIKTKDSILVGYASNWMTRITADPGDWNLVVGDASAISDVVTPYVTAYNTLLASRESGIYSQELTRIKDDAKDAMLDVLRMYYTQIQADTAVTDGNKELLGITLKKQRTPIGPPTEKPTMDIKAVDGFTVFVHVHGEDENRNGLPPGTHGIMLYGFIGELPSSDIDAWTNLGIVTRSEMEIPFPSTTIPGAKVWLRCCYFSPRGECGPASNAVYTNLQFAPDSMQQAA